MQYNAADPEAYIAALPEERRYAVERLRRIFRQHLPQGFEETMSYGMIAYVVPLSVYPRGYHARAGEPLPFINIASQKNHIALYHMGLYADPELLTWFKQAWKHHSSRKADMGKSCLRFKNPATIPYALIEELAPKMSCARWIELYEQQINRKSRRPKDGS